MSLTILQQEFKDTLFRDPDIAKAYTEDSEIEALDKEIKSMNASELRQNIKIWKETNQTLDYEQ